LKLSRGIDKEFNIIKDVRFKNQFVNIEILNNSGFKGNRDPIQFLF
jgi:hypothetical protein